MKPPFEVSARFFKDEVVMGTNRGIDMREFATALATFRKERRQHDLLDRLARMGTANKRIKP
jgi:hypothetical protein